ncbi:MAG: hypothetical protein PHU85_13125, partial [Phycisphaerae bacterium]|nr:hypothetical protein [Phycisphaerae bacterium]
MVALLTVLAAGRLDAQTTAPPTSVTPAIRQRSIDAMRQTLDQEQRWIKVHAAEYLLELDYRDGVREVFLKELDLHGDEPEYRIGIWRVLARAAVAEKDRKTWIGRISEVIADRAAPDRGHAIESLAKLRTAATDRVLEALQEDLQNGSSPVPPYAVLALIH